MFKKSIAISFLLASLCTQLITYAKAPKIPHAITDAAFREDIDDTNLYAKPSAYISHMNNCRNQHKIKILVVGDSWAKYPRNTGFFQSFMKDYGPSNLPRGLSKFSDQAWAKSGRELQKFYILNESNNGEEVANMAKLFAAPSSVAMANKYGFSEIPVYPYQSKEVYKNVTTMPYWGFDYALLSAGGNDILGGNLNLGNSKSSIYEQSYISWILTKHATESGKDWFKCIDEKRLEQKLALIKDSYKKLITGIIKASDATSNSYTRQKKIKILAHTYDFLVPSSVGVAILNDGVHISSTSNNILSKIHFFDEILLRHLNV